MKRLVLLYNFSSKNIGDLLMVQAAREWLRELDPQVTVALPWDGRGARAFLGADVEVVPTMGRPGSGRRWQASHILLSIADRVVSVLRRFGLKIGGYSPQKAVAVVLDISGYWLGTPWKEEQGAWFNRRYKQFHDRGAKIVLLPKTYGPFDSDDGRRQLADAIGVAHLVCVRDVRSMDEIKKAGVETESIALFPDYTARVKSTAMRGDGAYAVVIPSSRLFMGGRQEFDLSAGAAFFSALATYIHQTHGIPVKFVVHQTGADALLVDRIEAMHETAQGFSYWRPGTPESVKSVIGGARVAVSGRLHGLYNCIYQQVPVVCLAWSFKYRAIARQLQIEDCIIEGTDEKRVRGAIDRAIDDHIWIASYIERCEAIEKWSIERNRTMFNQIVAAL